MGSFGFISKQKLRKTDCLGILKHTTTSHCSRKILRGCVYLFSLLGKLFHLLKEMESVVFQQRTCYLPLSTVRLLFWCVRIQEIRTFLQNALTMIFSMGKISVRFIMRTISVRFCHVDDFRTISSRVRFPYDLGTRSN